VLRLTSVSETESTIVLKVDGEITSRWSAVLETECRGELAKNRKVVLDFSGVTQIDRRGAQVVTALRACRVKVTNCWPVLDEQIRHLANNDDA
jgi:anti-anti-sigma regulatory factor